MSVSPFIWLSLFLSLHPSVCLPVSIHYLTVCLSLFIHLSVYIFQTDDTTSHPFLKFLDPSLQEYRTTSRNWYINKLFETIPQTGGQAIRVVSLCKLTATSITCDFDREKGNEWQCDQFLVRDTPGNRSRMYRKSQPRKITTTGHFDFRNNIES